MSKTCTRETDPKKMGLDIKAQVIMMLRAETGELSYKAAAERVGIPESNYWRLMREGKIGGPSLFIIMGYLVSKGWVLLESAK